MLINLSNHPSNKWSTNQMEAAISLFGEVIDLPFPLVDPCGDESYIELLASEYVSKVIALTKGNPYVVHLMGEMTLSFAILKILTNMGVQCVASTSERVVKEVGEGRKEATFSFVKFRKY